MTRAEAIERAVVRPRWLVPSLDGPAVAAWLLPFTTILVLGFSGGGYDSVVRGQAGLVVWWLILLGAVVGTVSLRTTRAAGAAMLLLGAFAVWTTLGLSWSESTEKTWAEVARVATLLGVLVLGVAAQRRVSARHTVNGAASAIAVVAGAAVLSRLQPQLFGAEPLATIFSANKNRLAYPLGYWNLLGGLAVMGLPLLLSAGASARATLTRAAASAAVPVVVLCIFLTVSRGALGAGVVALVVFSALAPDRLPKLALIAVTALGSLLLCVAADRRDALQANLGTELAHRQGDQLLGLTLLVVAGTALLVAALALADRHATRPRWARVPRRAAGVAAALVVLVGVVGGIAAGGAGELSDRWHEFQQTEDPSAVRFDSGVARLRTVAGGGRYEYWVAAADAEARHKLTGVGPGAFEYWWSRTNTSADYRFVRDSHSLWFDALGETGLIGCALIAAFFLLALVGGAARALRARDHDHRLALAAATAGLAGFLVVASLEWAWEMTVLSAGTLLLVAVALAGGPEGRLRLGDAQPAEPDARRRRIPLALAAIIAIIGVGIPTAAASDLRDSQQEARAGNLAGALQRARSSAGILPSSSSAFMQEALLLERDGQFAPALGAAEAATRNEPTNWRTWVVRSRLEARGGQATAALRSYERARALNPRSLIFRRR